jgi:hypothetical protein
MQESENIFPTEKELGIVVKFPGFLHGMLQNPARRAYHW